MLLQFFAASLCDVMVLFIYCSGGEIVIHACEISNDVYQLNWYQFDGTTKMWIRLMIARTQKPYYFGSFKTLNCSLETFAGVCIIQFYSINRFSLKLFHFAGYSKGRWSTHYATKHLEILGISNENSLRLYI